MIVSGSLRASAADFAARTGWVAKPEGLCKGSMCVPLPGAVGDELDLSVVAERLGMPVVHDEAHGVWALGPATVSGRALESAEAPAELTLPSALDGRPFSFSSLRGRRAVVFSWASW